MFAYGDEPRAVLDAIADTRRRHERWTALMVVAACAISLPGVRATVQAAGGEADVAAYALVAATMAYYAAVLFWTSRRHVPPGLPWLHTTIEITVISTFIWVYSAVSVEFALTTSTAFLYPGAIALAALRLDVRLPAYAGALAAAEQLALY